MAKRGTFPIRLSCSERRLADALADRDGCSTGELIRRLIAHEAAEIVDKQQDIQERQ